MKAFIDTNVLIYWVDTGERADVVEQLLAGNVGQIPMNPSVLLGR